MKKIFKVLKRDMYLELLGLIIGIIAGTYTYNNTNNITLAIILGLLISIVLIYIINRLCLYYIAYVEAKITSKEKYINPEEIKGLNPRIDKIIELDEELNSFLDKYASGKGNDLKEKKLNNEWKKKSDYFVKKADSILSIMDNEELLNSILATDQICNIVNIFSYFEPFMINVDYFLEHPKDLTEAYYITIANYNHMEDMVINPYYLYKLTEQNYFEEIECFILSHMDNNQIMKLANSSNDWYKKLYYYGYLKK